MLSVSREFGKMWGCGCGSGLGVGALLTARPLWWFVVFRQTLVRISELHHGLGMSLGLNFLCCSLLFQFLWLIFRCGSYDRLSWPSVGFLPHARHSAYLMTNNSSTLAWTVAWISLAVSAYISNDSICPMSVKYPNDIRHLWIIPGSKLSPYGVGKPGSPPLSEKF